MTEPDCIGKVRYKQGYSPFKKKTGVFSPKKRKASPIN
jgi:hypothetical protein